jgi:hypothetical protein
MDIGMAAYLRSWLYPFKINFVFVSTVVFPGDDGASPGSG